MIPGVITNKLRYKNVNIRFILIYCKCLLNTRENKEGEVEEQNEMKQIKITAKWQT